jgi:hypothetical protein
MSDFTVASSTRCLRMSWRVNSTICASSRGMPRLWFSRTAVIVDSGIARELEAVHVWGAQTDGTRKLNVNIVNGPRRAPRLATIESFGPEHAHTIASGGLSKDDVQKFLYERARNKVGQLKLRAMYKSENWPDWVDQADEEALCPIVGKPEDIHIVVTGGPGKHSTFIPTFGTSKSVTWKIEVRVASPRRAAGSRPR